jgi:hypothetical protein
MTRRQPDVNRLDWCDQIMAQGPGCTIQLKRLPTGNVMLTWSDGTGGELAYIGTATRDVLDKAIEEALEAEHEK